MFSAAAERNKGPILEALRSRVPPRGRLLEIACGSLQHALHMAPAFPSLIWQPTDADPEVVDHGVRLLASGPRPLNLQSPLMLDVRDKDSWPQQRFDTVFTANLLHISPPVTAHGLFDGSSACLRDNGTIHVYGPFKVGGRHTSASNARFDEALRAQHPEWGVRDLDDLAQLAGSFGFELSEALSMPANNLLLQFQRRKRRTR